MKKYLYVLPTILTDMFLVFIGICWVKNFNINNSSLTTICAIFAIPVLIHLIQTILGILDSVKNKRIVWAPILLLLNIIILPYYTNKYVLNKIVLKNSVITYFVSALFLCALMGIYTMTIVGKNTEVVIATIDGRAEFKLDSNWKKKDMRGYSLYVENNKKKLSFGVETFDLKVFEGYTIDGLLSDRENYLASMIDIVDVLSPKEEKEEEDKIIKTVTYKVKEKNADVYSIYILSVVNFKADEDYILYIFEQTDDDSYKKYKEDLYNVVKEVKLK